MLFCNYEMSGDTVLLCLGFSWPSSGVLETTFSNSEDSYGHYFLLGFNEFFPKSCTIDALCLHFSFTQQWEELGNPLKEAGYDDTGAYRPC